MGLGPYRPFDRFRVFGPNCIRLSGLQPQWSPDRRNFVDVGRLNGMLIVGGSTAGKKNNFRVRVQEILAWSSPFRHYCAFDLCFAMPVSLARLACSRSVTQARGLLAPSEAW